MEENNSMTQYLINLQFYIDFAFYVSCSSVLLLLNSTLRPNFLKRLPFSILIIIAGIAISPLLYKTPNNTSLIVATIKCLASYSFCILFIVLAFFISVDAKLSSVLLTVVVGYAIKQASESILFLIQYIPNLPTYFDPDQLTFFRVNFIKFPLFIIAYLFIYLVGIKKYIKLSPPQEKILSAPYLSILITAILCLALNFVRGYKAPQSKILDIVSILYGFACCILTILIYFGLLESTNYKRENQMMQKIWEEQEAQLNIFRQSICEIETKYHDLKRNLQMLKNTDNPYADELIKDIEYSLGSFDSKIETGNITFDTLITRYRMQCLQKNIRFSIIADGKLLDFMSSTDIVALIGNIIENAIEAVSSLVYERRSISLSVTDTMGFITIHEENPYEGELKIDRGIILSTKPNKEAHGFGTKSIDYITKKYGGDLSINTQEKFFKINILFKKP